MRKKLSGSITPFLSLILLLMLAMLGTLLEAARVQTGKNMAKEALNTAVESQLSQFYLPLYEDYHLFFMERGIDTEKLEQKELLESIQEYMLYTFDAAQELKGNSWNIYSDFYDLKLQKTDILKLVRAVENDGNLLRTQAIEYSKYNSSGTVLDSFSKQLEMVKSSRKASEIIEKKLETEEKLSEVSGKILEIMELVEGVSCNKKKTALQFTKLGNLKSEEEFAKKFCPDTVTAVHVGVNHTMVWNLLKDKYQTPVAVLEEVKEKIDKLEKNVEKIDQFSNETENLKKRIAALEGELQQKNEEKADEEGMLIQLKEEKKNLEEKLEEQASSKTVEKELRKSIEIIKEQIKDRREKIEGLSETVKKIEESIDRNLKAEQEKRRKFQQIKEQQEAVVKNINDSIQSMVKQAKEVQKKSEKALGVISSLKEKQSQAQDKLKEYKTVLAHSEDELTEELKAAMKKDLEELEKYETKENSGNSNVTRVVKMKPVLEKNIGILKQVSTMSDVKVSLDNLESCKNQKKKINQIINCFKEYHIDTLQFDYSTLQPKKDTKDPIDIMSSSLTDGTLEMVLPPDVILSNKKISNPNFYYLHYAKSRNKNEADTALDYKDSLENSKKEGYQSEITNSFGTYGKSKENLKSNSQALLEKMLFQQYCNEHFKNFMNVTNKNKQTTGISLSKENPQVQVEDTILEYEQEYLLVGGGKDKDNLKIVVNKIIFIRTVMNFIYLMTDDAKKKVTYTTAAALVGFSGLEPLVRLTQTMILLTWAYEEALVDTGALMAGKSVPLMKDKNSFLLQYQEMFYISKGLIQKKIAMVKESKAVLSMKYKDYVQIFFMSEPDNKKSYRAMDLIEGNLRKRNANQFTFSRAIYGMDVFVDVSMKTKFLRFPIVQDFTRWTGNGWKFSIEQSHSY